METLRRSIKEELRFDQMYLTNEEMCLFSKQHKDYIYKKIKNILVDSEDQELFEQINNMLCRFELSFAVIAWGSDDERTIRGAAEYIRLFPILASFLFENSELIDALDDLSQVHLYGQVEANDYFGEVHGADLEMYQVLGEFGMINDEYNEQRLSLDFLPIIGEETKIGKYTIQEIALWASSYDSD